MNFASLITILTFPVTVLFPAFSKLNPKSEEARRLFTHSVKYTSLIIIPAATIAAVVSKDLVAFIYGSSYNLAPLLLSIYTLNYLYAGIGSLVLGHLLTGAGETKLILEANLINLTTFLPSAPIFTWLYGVPGIIAALLISTLLSLTYQLLKAKKKFKVNFNPVDSTKIYLSSVLSAVPTLLYLQLSPFQNLLNIILSGSLYLATYLTLAPLVGAINAQDIENLKLLFGNIKMVWPFLKLVLNYEARLISTLKA
jgi:O-antigen/teichoic acid export membrane protein